MSNKREDVKKPLSLREVVVIILSGHLGVRNRDKRVNDFARANGLQIFIAAVVYFLLVIAGLVTLAVVIAG